MVYLINTRNNIAFCETIDDVYNALVHRSASFAKLYSADDFETLRSLAMISQFHDIDNNTTIESRIEAIQLPEAIVESTFLQAGENEKLTSFSLTQIDWSGEWAISALNGFCTAKNDFELCNFLAGGNLVYPVAIFLQCPHEHVVMAARRDYVKRFYSRYRYDAERSELPQQWLESFLDRFFEQREKRLQASMSESWRSFQMTRLAMGW
ncbi:MAG: hypothetical protein IJ575_00640 [Selenomonadaceae bacterium]|nr:hypothetical protein [Selenomonadaceae bacterium]